VLFSGGQDSTVCLAWALERYARVLTLGFAYGQRHEVELIARARVIEAIRRGFQRWGERLGDDLVLELATFGQISETALTRDAAIAMTAAGLPTTFVPGRNILFFTYAAALAYRRGIRTLIGGMCETDYAGYPDCRSDTLRALARTLSLGMATEFTIETPLMWIDKAGTWALANELGGQTLVDVIVEHTHTCYLGDHEQRHDWGYGCGTCPACKLRATGWERWQSARN
jgi:7-cyano-7-deazaguanine synthase